MKMNDNMKVPEGWKRVRLGKIADIKTGNSNVEDAIDNGLYPLFDRSLQVKRSNKYLFDTEAVIIPGEGSDFCPKYYNGKFDLHQRAYAIFNYKGLDGKYLFYAMHKENIQLIKHSVGTTVISLRLPNFQNLFISLPPLPEQQKIAEILETIDNAIEKTDKIIEKYKRIKQGLMQDLLTKGIDENGKIRSEKTHKFKTSPLGRIPEEWEVVRLGEVSEIKGGKRLPKGEELIDEGHPYIRLVDIEGIRVNASKVKYIPEKIKQLISRYIVSKNDVILSIAGTIGLVALIPNELDGSNLTENAVKITNLKNLDKNFLAFTLSNYLVQRQINMLTGVVAQPKLALFRLATIPIPLPPFPEQQRIAEILSQIDNTIEKEEAYKQKLDRIKKGLMEDLLTGRVRVNELIKEVKNEK